jgi:uncharacterized phage-associated protein
MPNIRFNFDQDKLTAVLTFFASRVNDLDALKSAKLLYFADKRHLLRYGRPILGDNYFGMDHGPVPERAYDQIKSALDRNHSVVPPHFAQYLIVDMSPKYPRFKAKCAPDMDMLSDSDVEVLEEILAEYGHLSAWALRDLTHKEPEVRESDEKLKKTQSKSVPIPFDRFFDAARDRKILASVEATQSDRDFAASLK